MRDVSALMHVGIANPRWRGKRSRHSRRMRNIQFYISGKRSMWSVFGIRFPLTYFLCLRIWNGPLSGITWTGSLLYRFFFKPSHCKPIEARHQYISSSDARFPATLQRLGYTAGCRNNSHNNAIYNPKLYIITIQGNDYIQSPITPCEQRHHNLRDKQA